MQASGIPNEVGSASRFTIVDKDVRARDAVTVLRCDTCGITERVYDQPDNERAQDEAERIHQCPPMCVACGEPMPEADRAFNVLACLPCRMDDPEGTQRAVTARIEAMTVGEMRDYLSRQREAVV